MLSMVLNQSLFVAALSLTTATNIGIISPSIAVFSTAISAMLCIEKLSMWQVFGVGLTVSGALIILKASCRGRPCHGAKLIEWGHLRRWRSLIW